MPKAKLFNGLAGLIEQLECRLFIYIPIVAICFAVSVNNLASAHEGYLHVAGFQKTVAQQNVGISESDTYFHLFTSLVAQWPTPLQKDLINQAWLEHQFIHRDPAAPGIDELRKHRQILLRNLEKLLPVVHVDWTGTRAKLNKSTRRLSFCRTIASPLLVTIHNRTNTNVALGAVAKAQSTNSVKTKSTRHSHIPANSETTLLTDVLFSEEEPSDSLPLTINLLNDQPQKSTIDIPVILSQPATIRGTVRDGQAIVPARITVTCEDGVCRYGGEFATKSTFTNKPIIYPPIRGWKKTTFFYTDGTFKMAVPPGTVQVNIERGFEHKRGSVSIQTTAGKVHDLDLSCDPLIDLSRNGWVSGDTHVHWVTNQWNVDEPLKLLAMVQRAEGLRVANNLTLLQRYSNQAFIKPSQAPMGPIAKYSDSLFHMQMGEEYRNENLYGHLCFLNIDWLVQPIGTGSIIAGPDALDYPLNRTAIEACRTQGGISIEAHGTGGNKDVPINVIHNLSDSLDQMEPTMYYHFLDCGFRLPLTNGSDHPARSVGIARAYVKVDGEFSYDRWIMGIRKGRTFTTSGPLILLSVNDSEIGDVLPVGPNETLKIRAKVISRDPIGKLQIISNGKVLAEKVTEQVTDELNVTLEAEASRWIIARCSNRTDGRADWGFGNFNAITGPGIAHTSPVYIEVDGYPRFDPPAAAYWQDRLRLHETEVQTKGRFGSTAQRKEAIDYLQQGFAMYGRLAKNIDSARSRSESLEQAKQRLLDVVNRFGSDPNTKSVIRHLKAATKWSELESALAPLTLFNVSIDPESRVKMNRTGSPVELREGRPQRFFARIENKAGITFPLNLTAVDLAKTPTDPTNRCTINVINSPFTSHLLTGAKFEFKVIEITPHFDGQCKLRVTAELGQGSQDIGLSSTTDLLLDAKSKRPISNE